MNKFESKYSIGDIIRFSNPSTGPGIGRIVAITFSKWNKGEAKYDVTGEQGRVCETEVISRLVDEDEDE